MTTNLTFGQHRTRLVLLENFMKVDISNCRSVSLYPTSTTVDLRQVQLKYVITCDLLISVIRHDKINYTNIYLIVLLGICWSVPVVWLQFPFYPLPNLLCSSSLLWISTPVALQRQCETIRTPYIMTYQNKGTKVREFLRMKWMKIENVNTRSQRQHNSQSGPLITYSWKF